MNIEQAAQIANEVSRRYNGNLEVDILPRRGMTTVYGFHTIPGDSTPAKDELRAAGFQIGANSGRYVERG